MINQTTGRIHTQYVQTGTGTGRLSSKDPNLQNIPARDEEGRLIRTAFVPSEGMKLVSADYAQVELAVLAYLSKDTALLGAFREGRDLHRQTASHIFGVSELAVTDDQRRVGKTINFGVVYGQSAYGLARSLKIGETEAKKFINAYFRRFEGVAAFKKQTLRDAKKFGYVKTLLGRRRRLPDIHSSDWGKESAAERAAVNSPIQGSAADLIKLAMVKLHRRLEEGKTGARILLQVHDELILEAPEDQVSQAVEIVKKVMEHPTDLEIPLSVQCTVGDSWAECH